MINPSVSSWSTAAARTPKLPGDDRGKAKSTRAAARIEVRWLPVASLRPAERNARAHSARQVARIAESIAAFGFNVPVLVDEKARILAGHGRVLAARRLGLKEVPTIMLAHLDEAERRAFMIADNRTAELASWDEGRLGLELRELRSLDLDFDLAATGFELGEIDLRIGSVATAPGAQPGRVPSRPPDHPRVEARVEARGPGRPDEVRRHATQVSAAPRPGPLAAPRIKSGGGAGSLAIHRERRKASPVAQAGETWRLGSNRLICGDDVDPAALSALDAVIRRWQAETGESARLPTGETFAAIARGGREFLSLWKKVHESSPERGEGADAGRERR
jgi:ParB-like chromosome segregation protein Spo0J